jgi:AcrR family transcriptional regulator
MTELTVTSAGGRGARGRILATATTLFYRRGINATGMKDLAEAAHVSTRSLYQHFPSKEALVAAYLTRWDTDRLLPNEASLDDPGRAPRDRILDLFADPGAGAVARGCPFHNAAVEITDVGSAVRDVVSAHKQRLLDLITEAAAAYGAGEPAELGYQIAVLYEGATAWFTSTADPAAFGHARAVATTLLDAAA